jgi:hypothetical protein
MSTIKTGGPAFPQQQGYPQLPDNAPWFEGLTVRDYFAAKAMQASIDGHFAHYGHEGGYWSPADIASYAYECADAMLKARQA